MRVLIIGRGAREHSIGWKVNNSPKVSKLYFAPGNGGTCQIGENLDIQETDIDKLLNFALNNKIDLTIVGPEIPLVMGIVDEFEKNNLKIFGPNKRCAKLEGSKDFTKKFLIKNNIPTARYETVNSYEQGINALKEFNYPLVIKADGLAAGKGVIIVKNKYEATETLKEIMIDKKFHSAGNKVVIEEFLEGIECSLLCFVDGDYLIPLESAKDYKSVYDHDLGPNTGGMGSFSPNLIYDNNYKEIVEKEILKPMMAGFKKENLDYKGVLFIGIMMTNNGPKVLEINVRFGDPETQCLLMRLNSDLFQIMYKIASGTFKGEILNWKKESSLCLVMASGGYPNKYFIDEEILVEDNSLNLFHGGTKVIHNKLYTNGGRVLSLVSMGENIEDAREKVYKEINKVKFSSMHHRTDIGIVNNYNL